MRQPGGEAVTVRLPVFDKGADDRSGQRERAAQVLVLEGWCLGVHAQPEDLLQEPINALERDEDPQGIWRSWVNNQIECTMNRFGVTLIIGFNCSRRV